MPTFTKAQSRIPFARVNHNKYMVTDNTAYIGGYTLSILQIMRLGQDFRPTVLQWFKIMLSLWPDKSFIQIPYGRTPPINAQCPMLINANQNSAIDPNADQSALIGIERHFGSMPWFWSALIGIGQWSRESWYGFIVQTWASMRHAWLSFLVSIKLAIDPASEIVRSSHLKTTNFFLYI